MLREVSPYIDELVVATQDRKYVDFIKNSPESEVKHNVYYYEWADNFADARNDTFSKASNDIILWLDADDTLRGAEHLEEVAQLIEDGKLDWAWFQYEYEKDELGNVLMRQWQPRLIRKGTGHWEMPIHESFVPDKEIVQTMYDEVVVEHHTTEDHRLEHGKRNLKILLADYQKNGEKTDPRILYYLGNTLMALEKFEEAVPFYHMHIEQCGWAEEKYFSLHYLSHCYARLNQWDAAINIAMEATKIFPIWNLAFFDLGAHYSNKAATGGGRLDWKRAIEWFIIGLTKQKPDSKGYFTNDLDYTRDPMLRLADCYLQTGEYVKAFDIAKRLRQDFPKDPLIEELYKTAKEVVETEDFVEAFQTVALKIGNMDRIKGAKLFDALPTKLDEDHRIQSLRLTFVPPKTWEPNSVVIYCGPALEDWAKPSIYTGIGGSESAVIYLSEELVKLGYKVTVYNQCGDFRGVYAGVEYLPFYHFNWKDNFNYLVSWRTPGLFAFNLKAKKKYLWLHDIAFPQYFSDRSLTEPDKILFLSKWHRNNLPDLPEEKVFITNNGINPKDFENLPPKEPNTLFWGSSYDRGLLPFIKNILPTIVEAIPDVKLHVAYGWQNILKEKHLIPALEQLYTELSPILQAHPNIIHHDRLPHKELIQLMGKCMVYPYASEFGETNNITSQNAQAAGCYVITTSQAGGTLERVKLGRVLTGDGIYTNKELQQRFANATIEALSGFKRMKALTDVNLDLKEEFSWATTAKQWDKELLNETS